MIVTCFVERILSRLRIALIGSRELEKNKKYEDDIKICYNVCLRLAQLKIKFTSGLCELGMDGIAQKAYSKALDLGWIDESYFEVYVAEQKNIDRSSLPNKHLAKVRNKDLIKKSEDLARSVMGDSHWNNCNEWSRGMHSRNCHQILGWDLESPVDAVICWTPEGKVVGGTATALKLAMKAGIPIFNLGRHDQDKVLEEIRQFLLDHNVVGVNMNTQDYIDSIKQKNLEKAKWVLKMRFGDDLNKLKEFYENRQSEHSWADLKTVIEVLESESEIYHKEYQNK